MPKQKAHRKPDRDDLPPSDTEAGKVTAGAVRSEDIHPTIQFICARLAEHGHQVLIVGGAVRDLLLGTRPKDFDLATSARPEAVKQLFRNARIIGRRFRLVLLRYPDMTVEVSTFRGEAQARQGRMIQRDNRYGTWEEDAFRRDFTINSLALDPETLEVLDPVRAMADLKARRLRTIKPPPDSFAEDPVRMLRAVRFQVRLGFRIDPACVEAIARQSRLLEKVSRHRLADELQRFINHPKAPALFTALQQHGLLKWLLGLMPHGWFFDPRAQKEPLPLLMPLLESFARLERELGEPASPTVALLGLVVALATAQHQAWLLKPGKGPKEGLGPFKNTLGGMLSKWGLLNGQVGPALAILDAARSILAEPHRFNRPGEPGPYLPGIREAWLLLHGLRDVLSLPGELLSAGAAQLATLPDLPILDHPRPRNRGSHPDGEPRRHAHGAEGAPQPGTRRRRRRSRRRKPT